MFKIRQSIKNNHKKQQTLMLYSTKNTLYTTPNNLKKSQLKQHECL